MDAFGRSTEILLAPPRAKCRQCAKVWTVPVPWEGKGKHFTKDLEVFAGTLMREMPVRRAGEILGEGDTRLWRVLFRLVKAVPAALDLPKVGPHRGRSDENPQRERIPRACPRRPNFQNFGVSISCA